MKPDYKMCYTILLVCLLVVLGIIIYFLIGKPMFIYKNGFQNPTYTNYPTYNYKWSDDLIRRFNIYQTTMNQNVNQYDLSILQKQASPEEAEELLRTGYWPWSNELKYLYLDKVWSNPIIKINPKESLDYAMKKYNQSAATELLAWNSKEGEFLLYGGDLGVTDEMPENRHNTIKCSTDINGDSIMQKQVYTGVNLWNGYMNSTVTNVANEDIPKEMAGFSFVKGVCNPCKALNYPGDYSCPFRLNVEGDDSISEPWKILWKLN